MNIVLKQLLTIFLWASLVVLVSTVPDFAAAADRSSTAHAPRDATVKVNRDDLAAPIAERGEVRVIVGLRPTRPFVPQLDDIEERAKERDVNDGQARLLSRLSGHRVSNVKRFRYHHFVAMTVDAAALEVLMADPEIISVSVDRPVFPVLNDTPGITRADKAWLEGFRGAGQAVAILDSGVDTSHPFFAGKIIAEACFSDPAGTGYFSYCPNPQAPTAQFPGTHQIGPGAGRHCPDTSLTCWHGTHVAGIAAGKTGVLSATGAGMAPEAQIIPIQVFQKDCSGETCRILAFDSDLIHALEYVYSLRNTYNVAAANMSLGGGSYTAACDNDTPAMTAVINSLRNARIATVVASGNAGNTSAISFPACISSVISVGSTSKQNTVSSFSNSSTLLQLLAPGGGILSSMPGGGFGGASGTSMAAPHVAGAWALLKSAKPNASVTEVLNALQNTGVPIADTRNGITKRLIQLGYDATSLGALGTLLGHGNLLPSISISAPLNGAAYTAPANVTVSVTASDTDGGIAKVEYFSGATRIFESTTAPFSFTWTGVTAGSYSLTARATDVLGGTAVSAPVNIAVSGSVATYQITGAVTAGGAGLASVSVTGAGATCTASNAAGQYSCSVAQGYSGTLTPAMTGYSFTPASRSYSNVTSNQSAQDYAAAAVSNADVVWFDDALPAGAIPGGNEAWTWVSSNPAPFSGGLAHQSILAAGQHQHYFTGATNRLSVGVGDTLFAYVYLDPVNPPSRVMLQWNDGSWEHRAYWGVNTLGYSFAGMHHAGALPPLGQWVRLQVPASAVGLEGRVLNGMAFTLTGGRATWDYVGKTSTVAASSYTITGTVTSGGTGLAGVSVAGAGATCTVSSAAGQYSCTVSQGYTGTLTPSLTGYTFTPASRSYSNVTANQSAQDYTAALVVPTMFTINGTVTSGGAGLSGVSFAGAGAGCTASNAAGQYSCTVSQGYTGTLTPSLTGYTFTPASRSYSNVTSNQSAQDYAAAAVSNADVVWFDDALPAGAIPGGNEAWTWVSSNPAPFSGGLAHQSILAAGQHQHYFTGATNRLSVGVGDTLFAYVYLDPVNPPSQVMLQWNDGSWEHRAYWGVNVLGYSLAGMYHVGALPPLGQWVRLQVPASAVGLEGRVLNGMAFTLTGGRATWDAVGKR